MTAYIPSASSIGNAVIFTSVAANDSITLLQPFTFVSTVGYAMNIFHLNTTMLNMATLMSGGDYGIIVSADNCDIANTASGTIATLSAIYGYSAVYIFGNNNSVNNAGLIYATNGIGVEFGGNSTHLNNSGTILGYFSGVNASGVDFTIMNSGTIETSSAGSFAAVNLFGTGFQNYLNNSGVIQSLNASDDGSGGYAVTIAGSQLTTIENSGVIRSVGAIAISGGNAAGALYLANSGSITSSNILIFSVVATDQDDIILNSGTIGSSVTMGAGADLFNGIGGHIGGSVIGGTGMDTYFTDDAALTIVESTAEVDTVNAAVTFRLANFVENLTLLGTGNFNGFGNTSANVINGNAGDNRLTGLAGNDTMNGDLGDDRMLGGIGNDTMLGGDGDDVMLGGVGNDTARGEDGDDVLNGLAGTDLLAGGAGLDTFVFSALGHTTTSTATADTVSDFIKGEDHIDLSAIDAITTNAVPNDTFIFIGTAAFSNVAGQLRYSQAAGYTNIEMDVDGNSTVDGIIRLFGTLTVTASDFVL